MGTPSSRSPPAKRSLTRSSFNGPLLIPSQSRSFGRSGRPLGHSARECGGALARRRKRARGVGWGLPRGEQKLEDYLGVAPIDSCNGLGGANTAENLGRKYGIGRTEADEFAYRSRMLAAKARESCRFSEEIVPVEVRTKKGVTVVDKDEHIRPDTNIEALGKLVARFEKDGTVTAGNASGINDGAAALVV